MKLKVIKCPHCGKTVFNNGQQDCPFCQKSYYEFVIPSLEDIFGKNIFKKEE